MITDYGAIPGDVSAAYTVAAGGVDAGGDTSWLDLIPGGRDAYNYVVTQLSRFNLLGLDTIPSWKRALEQLGPIVAKSDAVTQQLFTDASNDVLDLQGTWELVQDRIATVIAQLRTVGLGVIPVATLAAIAATLVAVAAGMALFFNSANQRQQQVSDLVNRLVALGKLSAGEASALLRGGSVGSIVDSLGGKLVLGAVVLGGAYLFLNRRGR